MTIQLLTEESPKANALKREVYNASVAIQICALQANKQYNLTHTEPLFEADFYQKFILDLLTDFTNLLTASKGIIDFDYFCTLIKDIGEEIENYSSEHDKKIEIHNITRLLIKSRHPEPWKVLSTTDLKENEVLHFIQHGRFFKNSNLTTEEQLLLANEYEKKLLLNKDEQLLVEDESKKSIEDQFQDTYLGAATTYTRLKNLFATEALRILYSYLQSIEYYDQPENVYPQPSVIVGFANKHLDLPEHSFSFGTFEPDFTENGIDSSALYTKICDLHKNKFTELYSSHLIAFKNPKTVKDPKNKEPRVELQDGAQQDSAPLDIPIESVISKKINKKVYPYNHEILSQNPDSIFLILKHNLSEEMPSFRDYRGQVASLEDTNDGIKITLTNITKKTLLEEPIPNTLPYYLEDIPGELSVNFKKKNNSILVKTSTKYLLDLLIDNDESAKPYARVEQNRWLLDQAIQQCPFITKEIKSAIQPQINAVPVEDVNYLTKFINTVSNDSTKLNTIDNLPGHSNSFQLLGGAAAIIIGAVLLGVCIALAIHTGGIAVPLLSAIVAPAFEFWLTIFLAVGIGAGATSSVVGIASMFNGRTKGAAKLALDLEIDATLGTSDNFNAPTQTPELRV